MHQQSDSELLPCSPQPALLQGGAFDGPTSRNWYAIYTYPNHEKACEKQLERRGIEVFLPTVHRERVWKNRQRVKVRLPLFTSYLFVRIGARERSNVLSAPGVLRVLGNTDGPQSIPDSAIQILRDEQFGSRFEPTSEIAPGQKVRICEGALQGLEGVLIRKKNCLWFVLSIDLINQRAMVEVQARQIEPISA